MLAVHRPVGYAAGNNHGDPSAMDTRELTIGLLTTADLIS